MNIKLADVSKDPGAKFIRNDCTEEMYRSNKMGSQFEILGESEIYRFYKTKSKCSNCNIEHYKLLNLISRGWRTNIDVRELPFRIWENYYIPDKRQYSKIDVPCIYCKIDNAGYYHDFSSNDNKINICFDCVKYGYYEKGKFEVCRDGHDSDITEEEKFDTANEIKKFIKLQEEKFYRRLQYDSIYTLIKIWQTKRNDDLAKLPRDLIKLIISFVHYYKL